MNDPFETGIPKYATATSIYDALCELTQTEEMGILSEIFACEHKDREDGTCSYPDNLTPECHEECFTVFNM